MMGITSLALSALALCAFAIHLSNRVNALEAAFVALYDGDAYLVDEDGRIEIKYTGEDE